MSRVFAEEESHEVCKFCDYAIRNEECPGCGFSFKAFSIKEHDAEIRRQTIEEFITRIEEDLDTFCDNDRWTSDGSLMWKCDEVREIAEQMKGGAE